MTDHFFGIWSKRKAGDTRFADTNIRVYGRNALYSHRYVKTDRVHPALCATSDNWLYDIPRKLNATERLLCSSFPVDYSVRGGGVQFLTGMSVPPVMMAHVADAIYTQWLKPIKEGA